MKTLNKQTCVTCGQSVNEREITLYSGMVSDLWKVLKWCEERNTYLFQRKDIKHLFRNENSTARFGDWVNFGGLVFKSEKGHYGLNIERCRDFFAGSYQIPKSVYKNPLTKEITAGERVYINQIQNLTAFLDENRQYIARYREPVQTEFL